MNADAHFVQINESSIADKAMERKEYQMTLAGARIVTQQSGSIEAAETHRIRASGESSVLANITDNVSEGYTEALRISALFMDVNPDDQIFVLNNDFFAEKLDPQEMLAVTELWQKSVYPLGDLRDYLRKGEIIREDRTDEEMDKELNDETRNMPGINLDED